MIRSTLPRRAALTLAALAATLALGACAPAVRTSDTYYPGSVQRAQTVELGVVESLRPVTLAAPPTGAGAVAGGAIGGVAGSAVGAGRGSVVGAIAGAILGGIAGNAIERDVNKVNGIEIIVRLDAGRTIAVAQEGLGDEFRPGDRVRVLSDGYATRVTR